MSTRSGYPRDIPRLIRDNPDRGTHKAGYRRAEKFVIADIARAARIDTYLNRCSQTPSGGCGVLLPARNQSTLAVIVSRYRIWHHVGLCFIKGGGEPLGERQLHEPPRTRTSARERRAPSASPEGRGTPGEAGFLTKASAFRHPRDDESGKRYRSGLNNSDKGPSLAPLTRQRNLLAPARMHTALFSSLPSPPSHAVTTISVLLVPLSPLPWPHHSGDERQGEIDLCSASKRFDSNVGY